MKFIIEDFLLKKMNLYYNSLINCWSFHKKTKLYTKCLIQCKCILKEVLVSKNGLCPLYNSSEFYNSLDCVLLGNYIEKRSKS